MTNITRKRATYDFWLANGTREFGVIAGGVPGITDQDAPICLQRGDERFGEAHITKKHGHWLAKNRSTAPELVWRKCRGSGSIYCTETPAKSKIWLPIQPAALLLLQYIEKHAFWSVVTLYFHEGTLDGAIVGRYSDALNPTVAAPTFTIADPPKAPIIITKPRRRWTPQ